MEEGIPAILRKYHPNIKCLTRRDEFDSFMLSPQIKLLFVYMPGCGPCHRTAPELARITSTSMQIASLSSNHYAWLKDKNGAVQVQFSSGSPPEGFPHLELFDGQQAVAEIQPGKAEEIRAQLEHKRPFLRGKIYVYKAISAMPKQREGGSSNQLPISLKMQQLEKDYQTYLQTKVKKAGGSEGRFAGSFDFSSQQARTGGFHFSSSSPQMKNVLMKQQKQPEKLQQQHKPKPKIIHERF